MAASLFSSLTYTYVGFLFSIPCFYYIVGKPEYAVTGRFVLLSYNLTALFWYVIRILIAFLTLTSTEL